MSMGFHPNRRQWLWAAGGLAVASAAATLGWQGLRKQQSNQQALDSFWALELATPDEEARTIALAPLRGRPLLVNFWATWCPPCVRELPLLNALAQEQASLTAGATPALQILGIAVDQAPKVRQWLQRQPLAYPVLMAGAGGMAISRSLGNVQGGLPFSLLLDAQGQVRQRRIGEFSPEVLQRWMATIAT
ncbi:MAG: redoxin domain-containing protein [Comamonas sp.]|nr:redoxin domain-containing protein [Comamonas sp.]